MGAQMVAGIDLDLLDHINELPLAVAVGGTADWSLVVKRLRTLLRADGSVLMTEADNRCAQLDLQGHDEAAWGAYAAHFFALDPFMLALRDGRLAPGRVTTVDDLIPTGVLAASEYYNDFWRPQGIAHEVGAFCANGQGTCLHLALSRGSEAGSYQPAELDHFSVYVRHLFRALRLEAALAGQQSPNLDAFARRYGLTPAEAALLEALLAMCTLPAAANRLHRRHNTARAQLRAIFAKTGVSNQVALTTLVYRGWYRQVQHADK